VPTAFPTCGWIVFTAVCARLIFTTSLLGQEPRFVTYSGSERRPPEDMKKLAQMTLHECPPRSRTCEEIQFLIRSLIRRGPGGGRQSCCQSISRRSHTNTPLFHHMAVDHRGRNILMSKQLLHRTNIIPCFEQMSRKRIAENVATDCLNRPLYRTSNGTGQEKEKRQEA